VKSFGQVCNCDLQKFLAPVTQKAPGKVTRYPVDVGTAQGRIYDMLKSCSRLTAHLPHKIG